VSISRPVYCTREDVKGALDYRETARNDAQVDRAVEAAARAVEGALHRRFYPQTDTRYFDWPAENQRGGRPWRLWLDQHELISVTTLSSGGTTIAASDFNLEPGDGPPFTYLELDRSSSVGFGGGSTPQRDITIAGVFGYSADDAAAGTLVEALDLSETGVDVSDSAAVGVGDLVKVDSERMLVTGKSMLDTGQNTSALTAAVSDVSITGITAGTIAVGETILVDSERMLVVDVAGTTLTVKRAWDGTVLAAHSGGADIYAPRTLAVVRGAVGTTAASHDSATAVTRHVVPPLVRQLAVAEALTSLLQEGSGYARTVGSGEAQREAVGRGLKDAREQAWTAHGRKARIRAV
jgi:hypothetical protein